MLRFMIGIALAGWAGAAAATEAQEPSDLSAFYAQQAPRIKELETITLDGARPMAERVQAARELMSSYPEASDDLWDRWLGLEPDLALLAVADMEARLFALHYGHGAHEVDGATPSPLRARDTLRRLMNDDDRPAIRLAALNALCRAGDEVALEKLGAEVAAGRYQPNQALRHLSAKPEVGAPVLAKLAADKQVGDDLRLAAVGVMKGSELYQPFLRELALDGEAPSKTRLAALETLASEDHGTSDAALFLLTESDPAIKQAAFEILASEIRSREEPGQVELLRSLQRADERQPENLRFDPKLRGSLDAMIRELQDKQENE